MAPLCGLNKMNQQSNGFVFILKSPHIFPTSIPALVLRAPSLIPYE